MKELQLNQKRPLKNANKHTKKFSNKENMLLIYLEIYFFDCVFTYLFKIKYPYITDNENSPVHSLKFYILI